jgi:hypothetical protein
LPKNGQNDQIMFIVIGSIGTNGQISPKIHFFDQKMAKKWPKMTQNACL